jgi:outer membrane protein assembly factor BamE (lipoprotein component of BamABCDE complex)
MEDYNPINPSIDTRYTTDFDEEKFNSIEVGIDTVQIISLIGSPHSRHKLPDNKVIWYYTSDGKCDWYDFAWLGRELIINKQGNVITIQKSIHKD